MGQNLLNTTGLLTVVNEKNYHILNCLCIKLRNESHMYTSASTSADGVPRPTTTSSCTIVCTKLLTTCAVAEIAYTSKLQ